MKKVALLTIGLLMVCNFAFAMLPSLPENFGSASITDDFEILGFDELYTISKSNVLSDGVRFYDIYSFEIINNSDFEMWKDSARFKINRIVNDLDLDYYLYDECESVLAYSNSDFLEFTGIDIGTYYIGITGLAPLGSKYSYSAEFSVVPSSVPVPAAALLLGAGLLGIVGIRRRQIS